MTTAVIPPSPALRIAATVVAVLLAVALGTGGLLGAGAGVAAALGGITVVVMALMTGPRWHPIALGLAIAALASASAAASGTAWLVGVLTAVSALVTVPAVRRYGPVCGTAPVVVAAAGTEVAAVGPWATLAGVAVAAVAVPLVVAAIGLARIPPAPTPPRTTVAYAVALAAGSGTAIAVALTVGVAHALWLVVALSAVLVPVRGETALRARRRVVGTMIGTLVAAVIASFLPGPLAAALAVVAAVAGVGWSIAQDEVRGAAFVAGVLVLVAGASSTSGAWTTAVQRVALTAVGVALAILLAVLLARLERLESSS